MPQVFTEPTPSFPAGFVKPPGSVSARGTRWLAQQPPSAGRKSKTFDTPDEAWRWLARAHATTVLYGADTDAAGKMPLAVAMASWCSRLTVKETTRACYLQTLAPTLADDIAAMAVRDVRGMHVEALILARPIGHARAKTAEHLRAFFRWATANDLTARDPYIRSDGEKLRKHALKRAGRTSTTGLAWTVEQARTALAGMQDRQLRTLAAFMLITGARRGETLGLAWGGINGHVAMLARNHTIGGGKAMTEDLPKTETARSAYFGPRLAAMLEAHCPPGLMAFDDYVFTAPRKGGPLHPGAVSLQLTRTTQTLGLPRIGATHALRRTFATALDADGCPPIVREALLGHAGSRYAVAHEDDMRKWGERADELFLG
jgi:integrase